VQLDILYFPPLFLPCVWQPQRATVAKRFPLPVSQLFPHFQLPFPHVFLTGDSNTFIECSHIKIFYGAFLSRKDCRRRRWVFLGWFGGWLGGSVGGGRWVGVAKWRYRYRTSPDKITVPDIVL